MRLFSLSALIVLVSCSPRARHPLNQASTERVIASTATVAITSPTANSYINLSNVATFTVSGTCSEEAQDVVLVAGSVTETVACTSGSFTKNLNLTSLPQGSISVVAHHADAAGNESTPSSRSFIKDTIKPTAAITSPVADSFANISNVDHFVISGTCTEDGQEVVLQTDSVLETVLCTSGVFSKSLDLSALTEGIVILSANMADVAGNNADQATRAFLKDTIKPTAPSALARQSPSTTPAANATPTIRVSGLVSGDTITLYDDLTCASPALKGTGVSAGASIDIVTSTLSEIEHDFYAQSEDPAGNKSDCSSAHVVYEYDHTPPAVAITNPAANSYVNASNVAAYTFSGTCSESGRPVNLAAGSVSLSPTCSGGHTWSAVLDLSTLAQGDFTLTANHQDAAGNDAVQASRLYKKDSSVPSKPTALTLIAPANNPGSSATPTIRISGVSNGDTVKLYSDACVTESASGTSSGATKNLTSSTLAVGTYTFYATTTDLAGNVSDCSVAT